MNQKVAQNKAFDIMNKATKELYQLKELKAYDIWYILNQYADNELRQILEDSRGLN